MYNPEQHHRRSIRLKEYDYAAEGLYFVTICAHEYRPMFGTVIGGTMHLNDAGQMVEKEYHHLMDIYPEIICHEYTVMPNHFHAIIQISDETVGSQNENGDRRGIPCGCPTENRVIEGTHKGSPYITHSQAHRHTLGDIIGAFKSMTTNGYIHGVKQFGWTPFNKHLWQRNYYEHIIRDQLSFEEIVAYIIENPIHWKNDKLYIE